MTQTTEAPGETGTVLFADLGDSTRLYERLGDVRAHEVAADVLSRLEAVVQAYGGRIIKHIGDEVMCLFPDANDAVTAAREMQETVSGPAAEADLTIHIGLHCGPVLMDQGDAFGDAVNLAARMTSLARERQILTTGTTVAMLRPELQASTRLIERRHVKGKQADVDVHEVVWEQSEDRTEFKGIAPVRPQVEQLRVTIGSQEVWLGEDRPVLTIGRDTTSDIVIADSVASRRHAKIELSLGKWVLTDQSSNGTVVSSDDGTSAFVHNEQILLPAAGWLGIGSSTAGGESWPVRFEQIAAL